ncbi:hypothetical protein Tco_0930202 [Tanacetum coccineum]
MSALRRSAGNPVKEILLKLNLPDHMSILADSKVTPTKHERMTKPYTVTNKIRQDDEDEDEEPFAGSNRGSKRRRVGKEPESTSAPKEKTSKSTGKSKEGFKSHQKSTGKSAQIEEPIHTVKDLEELALQEFDTGFTEDRHVDDTTQNLIGSKNHQNSNSDRDWNRL